MKKYYLIILVSLFFISCSKDDSNFSASALESKKEIEVLDFESKEMMFKKIDEIILLKNQKQQEILNDFAFRNNAIILSKKNNYQKDAEKKDAAVLEDLKKYNTDKLNAIYELRKELNFTSILSIAEEINSLELINPDKAESLFVKYTKFLKRNDFQQVQTIFYDGVANVINSNGEVLIKGEKNTSGNNNSKVNSSGKFIRREEVVSDLVARSGNFNVVYQAGREAHDNDLGVRFFKYYCNLGALYQVKIVKRGNPYVMIPCPTTYTVDSGSIAGFAQTKSDFFSDYAFFYEYPSGYGELISNIGGNKNTAYVPVGGKVSGHFSTNTGGFYEEMTGSVTYKEN